MDKINARLEQIALLIDETGYQSVTQLSQAFFTSEITIRRDLKELAQQNRIRRMHGGGASIRKPDAKKAAQANEGDHNDQPLFDRLDVLITSDLIPKFHSLIQKTRRKKRTPIIAESLPLPDTETCVMVDNYKVGFDLGVWAGKFAQEHWHSDAHVLDLTYHRPNTQARSQGFWNGLRSILSETDPPLSINTQSRYDMAYQLTLDALAVHPDINIIFTINDITAQGAYDAIKSLGVSPEQLIILPVGIEGQTMLDLLMEGKWIAAGACMFPEIVATVCIEAAIASFNHKKLPPQIITPHYILTRETLTDFYRKTPNGWKIQLNKIPYVIDLPFISQARDLKKGCSLPACLGFVYTFVEHDWYKSLMGTMKQYATELGIALEIVDYEQTLKDEIHQRRIEIARLAASEVQNGDTVLIDAGPISCELAEHLISHKNITVITNSLAALEVLKDNSTDITVISTGGALRRSSQAFVGPTAESTLREFHIDKLFLMVSSVSKNLVLYHTNISEVTIKQLMIRLAKEVILLADHSCFQQESLVQVAPISTVNKLITDDALSASVRLELGSRGVTVVLATM